MSHPDTTSKDAVFQWRGIPEAGRLLPLGLQHVVAAVVGVITPAILVADTCGLSSADKTLMLQVSLILTALATLLQLFPIFHRIGSGLPVIMGISFAYIPTLQAIGGEFGLPTILGAEIVGGIVAIVFGVLVKWIRPLFPPLVTGTVIFTIGLSLYPTAVKYMAGGAGSEWFGSAKSWAVALITLAVVVFLNHFTKGITKLASILIGMLFGYVIAAVFFDMVSFSSVGEAAWFSLPQFMHFGVTFDPASCIAIGLLFAINSIQAIGDFTATTVGGMDRDPTDRELQGGIIAYGASNILTALFGGLPTATYSQNVGIVTTNKVINRTVFALTGVFLLLAGVSPKFAAILTTIPQCVLGGATVTVFSTIAMTGMKLVASAEMDYRNSSIVGLAAALGVGVSQANAALATLPAWVTTIFGKSPVVLATIVAIVLNLTLPKAKKKEEK